MTNSIKNTLGANSFRYLEKIFQLEYYLPLSKESEANVSHFVKEISLLLIEEDKRSLSLLIDKNEQIASRGAIQNVGDFLKTPRDLARFLNVFTLNYRFVSRDVFLPDYINVTILKLKYPEIYHALYFDRYKYLKTDNEGDLFFFEHKLAVFSLRYNENGNSLVQSALYNEIISYPELYSIPSNEIQNAVKIVADLFPNEIREYDFFAQKKELEKDHLSISRSECFNRYFDFSLSGILSETEFHEAMEQELEVLNNKVSEWCRDRNTHTHLAIKLEHLEDFSNRIEFEKAIRVIIHFGNQKENQLQAGGFNGRNFIQKLGGTKKWKSIVQKYYNGEDEDYKAFVRSLLLTNNGSDGYSYIHAIAELMEVEYEDTFILSRDEMKELTIDCYMATLKEADNYGLELLNFFKEVAKYHVDKSKPDEFIPIGRGIQVCKQTKEYIVNKGIVEYISKYAVYIDQFKRYGLQFWYKWLFETDSEFEQVINDNKQGNPLVEEFFDFYTKAKSAGVCIDYSFKYIFQPQHFK